MKGTVALWVPFATGIVVRAERIRTYMYNRCLSRASLFSRRERVCDWSVALGLAQAPPGSRGPVSFRFLARRRLRFLGDNWINIPSILVFLKLFSLLVRGVV